MRRNDTAPPAGKDKVHTMPPFRTESPDDISWDGDAVLFDTVFQPGMGVPFAWRVVVFDSFEALRKVTGDRKSYAWSRTEAEPNDDGLQALMLFGPGVPLSNVAHESLHIALFWARKTARPKQRAFSWLDHHPEIVAEIVGSMTAITWYNIPPELRDGSGDD